MKTLEELGFNLVNYCTVGDAKLAQYERKEKKENYKIWLYSDGEWDINDSELPNQKEIELAIKNKMKELGWWK